MLSLICLRTILYQLVRVSYWLTLPMPLIVLIVQHYYGIYGFYGLDAAVSFLIHIVVGHRHEGVTQVDLLSMFLYAVGTILGIAKTKSRSRSRSNNFSGSYE